MDLYLQLIWRCKFESGKKWFQYILNNKYNLQCLHDKIPEFNQLEDPAEKK